MVMPGRKFDVGGQYRYGFNGKENDNEVYGEGNQQDYGFRIYNTALARFLSVDPLTQSYPYFTPYQFAGNNPILSVDVDGLEPEKTVNENEKIKEILEHSENTPSWIQRAKANEKTPTLTFTNKEMIAITATVMGETNHGALSLEQQQAVGWVYYNRIARDGSVTKGLNGSYAFNRPGKSSLPTLWVMTWMVALGDDTYANQSSEDEYQTKTIGQLARSPAISQLVENAKALQVGLTADFKDPQINNPYPGFTGQGYWGDLNRPDGIWKMARIYFWLQEDGKVSGKFATTLVVKLRTEGAEKSTTFIFNEKALQEYFNQHPEQLPKDAKDVPVYNYTTDRRDP